MNIEEAGKTLYTRLFGESYLPYQGTLGVGLDTIFVYLLAKSRSQWQGNALPETWEGFPVTYHWNVKQPVAG